MDIFFSHLGQSLAQFELSLQLAHKSFGHIIAICLTSFCFIKIILEIGISELMSMLAIYMTVQNSCRAIDQCLCFYYFGSTTHLIPQSTFILC